MKKVHTRKIRAAMWALGMPTVDGRFADVMRAALRAGLDEKQAFQLTKLAYAAANGFTWAVPRAAQLVERATKERNAREHPRGRDAEDLAAERDGRPSRWGTPEFHRAAG